MIAPPLGPTAAVVAIFALACAILSVSDCAAPPAPLEPPVMIE